MEIKVLASGSSGNCYLVNGETKPLIECGILIKKIKEGLDYQLSSVDACLLSHGHQDHCKAAKDIVRAGIDLYASAGTVDILGLEGHRIHTLKAKKQVQVGGWKVMPFDVKHDAAEPLGFLIAGEGKKIAYITDSAYSPYKFNGITHFILEVNYDEETLKESLSQGVIDSNLYRRLLKTHMGLETAVSLLKANDLKKVEEVHIIHTSKRNGNEGKIKKRIMEVTGKMVFV